MAADTARMVMESYQSDNFYQVYGMTEAGPTGTVLFPRDQVTKAGSIGNRALPGADLQVIRTDGKNAAPGDIGEIWLQADSMTHGYYKNPEATKAAFEGGWYKTGDLVRMDADGYLYIVDRLKDMIVTGGENVYSKEVEDAIAGLPGVMETAVIGKPHPDWGETVVCFIVPKKGETVDQEILKQTLSGKLARYKIPREFNIVEELPHTASGKVMKFTLRDLERDE